MRCGHDDLAAVEEIVAATECELRRRRSSCPRRGTGAPRRVLCRLRLDDDGQRLVVDEDLLGGVDALVGSLGEDHGDRFADEHGSGPVRNRAAHRWVTGSGDRCEVDVLAGEDDDSGSTWASLTSTVNVTSASVDRTYVTHGRAVEPRSAEVGDYILPALREETPVLGTHHFRPERPGQYPYTRGPYASMYRSKLWTMRMFAGFGTPDDTNQRFHEILRSGGDGLSTAFDLPTLLGRDSDDPASEGEVGKCGVAVDTLADMEDLFAGIDLGNVTTSMTINSPAAVIFAMYIAVAENNGVERARLGGTLQNDILKEFHAQKEFVFPPRPSMRLVRDTVAFCAAELPRWHPISISGYHIREAGSTAAAGTRLHAGRRLRVRRAGAARRDSTSTRSRRGCPSSSTPTSTSSKRSPSTAPPGASGPGGCATATAQPPSARCTRFHTQTAGVSLTAQQPEVNIARTAIEALAGVLGGTQSLHTNSMDEALALPTEKAVRIALRTQQVVAHETGVANVADPLGDPGTSRR